VCHFADSRKISGPPYGAMCSECAPGARYSPNAGSIAAEKYLPRLVPLSFAKRGRIEEGEGTCHFADSKNISGPPYGAMCSECAPGARYSPNAGSIV
jgi:hypothetical protein